MKTIYIEKEIANHPRTQQICARYPEANLVSCDHYGEVFNRKAQNFRLQKKQPSLILANKFKNFVLETPAGYGVGGQHNYYFSHMMNCVYDCRYCFLQGMYRSAHYVVFVNYEDFETAIINKITQHSGSETHFFSGYDCDSLAFEPITGFAEYFLPIFSKHPKAWIELRTKSTQIRSLLNMEPIPNCIVAYSFTPEEISATLEHKVPSMQRRIDAMVKLYQQGWKLGLRFDPLIYQQDYKPLYQKLFEMIFSKLPIGSLHSVSLGSFRMPKGFFQNIIKLYPDEKLFAGPVEENQGLISYRKDIETGMISDCEHMLLNYIPADIYYPCTSFN